jgi:hypothetical protein
MVHGNGTRAITEIVVIGMLATVLAAFVPAADVTAETYQASFAQVSGNVTSENLARSVVLMDLNGDGLSDLVAGAPYNGAGGMANAGSISMFLSEGGVPFARIVVLNGTHAGDLLGWSATNAGDLDGDGYADLAVGAPLADPAGATDAGNITIIFGGPSFTGASGATLDSITPGEQLGYSLSGGGDVNRDGHGDLIAGAPYCTASGMTAAGRAYVFYGGPAIDSTPDKIFSGEVAGAHFGWSVSGNGSVDADTSMDIVVGAPDHKFGGLATGAAYIIRNINKANPGVSISVGSSAGDWYGASVAMVPDLDGDSYSDVAIGAPYDDVGGADAGSVSILLGGFKFNVVVDLVLHGQAAGEYLGWSIAGGNIRLDAFADLLVGAPNCGLNTTSAGRAYVFFGSASLDATADIVLTPDAGADFFGGSVCVGGNATGDMAPEFAVGDPLFTPLGLTGAGKAFVYEGVLVVIPKNPIVNGYVRVPGTSTGLSGFTVILENATFSKSTTTASSGYFEIDAVPGTYWLNASKAGYITNSTTVTLEMDDIDTSMFFPLRTPLVNGHVRDNVTAAAIGGATVLLWNGTALLASYVTPSNGSFWIYLPEASIPALGESIGLTLEALDGEHYATSSEFVIQRNETFAEELFLDRFPVVSGTVRDAITLSPVRDAVIEASQGAPGGSAASGANGVYSLVAVNASPGELFLNLTAAGYYRESVQISVDRNGSYSQDFFLRIDHIDPSSSLEALPTYTTSEEMTLNVSATDANGVAEVQLWYRFNGTGQFVYFGSDEDAPFVFTFSTAGASGDGLYEFYSQAVDYAGNNESPAAGNDTWTIVDTSAPVVVIGSLPEYTMTQNFTVTVTADDEDGVEGVTLFLAKNGSAPVAVGTDTSAPYEWTVLGEDWGMEGLYEFTLEASDAAGNARPAPSAPEATTFVDLSAPAIEITVPLPNIVTARTSMAVNWTSNDTGSDIKACKLQLDSGSWVNVGSNTTYNLTGLLHGPHTVTLNATDWAGRTTLKNVSFVVDIQPPVLIVSEPGEGDVIRTNDVDVTWSAFDAESGVVEYEVAVDGGIFESFGTLTSTQLKNLEDGPHDVVVRATDGVGNYKDVTIGFTVETGDGGGGGISALTVVLVVVVIVAIVAAVGMAMRGRNRGRRPGEGTDPKKKS